MTSFVVPETKLGPLKVAYAQEISLIVGEEEERIDITDGSTGL